MVSLANRDTGDLVGSDGWWWWWHYWDWAANNIVIGAWASAELHCLHSAAAAACWPIVSHASSSQTWAWSLSPTLLSWHNAAPQQPVRHVFTLLLTERTEPSDPWKQEIELVTTRDTNRNNRSDNSESERAGTPESEQVGWWPAVLTPHTSHRNYRRTISESDGEKFPCQARMQLKKEMSQQYNHCCVATVAGTLKHLVQPLTNNTDTADWGMRSREGWLM